MKAVAVCTALVLAAALALSAGAPASPPGPAQASAVPTAKVAIRGFAFHPSTLRVHRGTRVVWRNSDSVSHDVTDRGVFTTGLIGPGNSAAVRFKRRGVFSYICSIHPFMHGKIVVR